VSCPAWHLQREVVGLFLRGIVYFRRTQSSFAHLSSAVSWHLQRKVGVGFSVSIHRLQPPATRCSTQLRPPLHLPATRCSTQLSPPLHLTRVISHDFFCFCLSCKDCFTEFPALTSPQPHGLSNRTLPPPGAATCQLPPLLIPAPCAQDTCAPHALPGPCLRLIMSHLQSLSYLFYCRTAPLCSHELRKYW